MKNGFNETTFGDNQGRPKAESKVEFHNKRPAEDRRTFNSTDGGSNSNHIPSNNDAASISATINSTKAKVSRTIQTGGNQAYQRQFRTCKDFDKGLSAFIRNNEEAINEMCKDINESISRNILTDFQAEMQQYFMLFQHDVNESIMLLSHQQAKFKVYMETLQGLMSIFKISIPNESIKDGLSDATDRIIEDNK